MTVSVVLDYTPFRLEDSATFRHRTGGNAIPRNRLAEV